MKKIAAAMLAAMLAVSALAVGLTGCSDGTRVDLCEVTHSVFYAPLYVALNNGYFEEAGLDVRLTNAGGTDKVTAALVSGSADIGLMGPEGVIYASEMNDAPVVFGQLTKRDGSFLVSRKDEPDFKWTDLKGKEILAGRPGGVPAMTFEYVLNQNGLYDGTDLTLNFDIQFNLMTSAFEGGTGDYCTMFEPVASEYEAAGKGYVVASVGEASGEVPYTCFMAKNSWIKKHETEVDGFLRAVTKAVKYVMETPAATAAPYLTAYFESTSVSSITTSLQSYKDIDAWVTNLAMTEDSFTRLQDIIDNAGELSRRVAFDELINTAYADKAYKDVYN